MKNAGSPTEGIEQKNRGNSKKRKLYPVQDEDVFLIPDDFPEGLQYILNSTKAQLIEKKSPQ
jgi:hypothetical protein